MALPSKVDATIYSAATITEFGLRISPLPDPLKIKALPLPALYWQPLVEADPTTTTKKKVTLRQLIEYSQLIATREGIFASQWPASIVDPKTDVPLPILDAMIRIYILSHSEELLKKKSPLFNIQQQPH